jgi:hypothetical protein
MKADADSKMDCRWVMNSTSKFEHNTFSPRAGMQTSHVLINVAEVCPSII